LAVAQAPGSREDDSARGVVKKPDKPGKSDSVKQPAAKNDPSKGDAGKKVEAIQAAQRPMPPEREAAALTFARLHHPELAELLVQLKKNRPAEYQRALRDLFQASERLARIEEKSPERYELTLEAWKLESRSRLLAARMTMSDDPALEAELKATLLQLVDVRVRELKLERERIAQRVEKIDEMISAIEADREAAALEDLLRMKRTLGTQVSKPGRPAKEDGSAPKEKSAPNKESESNKETGAVPPGKDSLNRKR
jgi:hypothetical protein